MRFFTFMTKTAFGLNLLMIAFFSLNAVFFKSTGNPEVAMFFIIPIIIFSMLLPICSTKR